MQWKWQWASTGSPSDKLYAQVPSVHRHHALFREAWLWSLSHNNGTLHCLQIVPSAGILSSYAFLWVFLLLPLYFSLLLMEVFVSVFTVPGTVFLHAYFYPLQTPWDIDTIIISLLDMRRLRLREDNWHPKLIEFVSGRVLGTVGLWPLCGLLSEPILTTLHNASTSWVLWNIGSFPVGLHASELY